MTKAIELLTVGPAYVDFNCELAFGQHGLLPGAEVAIDNYSLVPGGSAPNAALVAKELGLSSMYVGKVGADAMGQLLESILKKSGLQTKLIIDPNAQTNLGFNFVDLDAGAIEISAGTAKKRLTGEEVEATVTPLLPETEYLMLGGLFKMKMLLPVLGRIAAAARNSGTKLVVDHGQEVDGVTPEEKKIVQALACQADYYIPSNEGPTDSNSKEFKHLWSVSSIEEGLGKLASISSATVVVKDGKNGAYTMINGEVVQTPAFPVEPINTIGAGDSFVAGFVLGQKEGLDIAQSMRLGCAVAALKISRRQLPTRQAANHLMALHTPSAS